MSRFEKLSHVIWHCQYHIVWVPKYRYQVLRGRIKEEVRKTLIIQAERLGCRIVELNSGRSCSPPCKGSTLWAQGYCVDTVGLDSEMILKYVKYQETH